MGRPVEMTGPWRDLSDRFGGVGQLARKIGVHPSTVWAWAAGREPAGVVQKAVNGQKFLGDT